MVLQKSQVTDTEEERRQRQIELNRPLIELLQMWIDEAEEPTAEDWDQFREFMQDIDAHRGERKLFEDYLK